MRTRLALTAAPTAMGIISLACGGVGPEGAASGAPEPPPPAATPQGEDLPVLVATSSAMTWPLTDGTSVQGTVLAAIDADPKTIWNADSGEVGTFWFRKPGASHVRIDADANTAEVRTMPLKGLSKPSPTDWAPLVTDGSWVALPSPDTAVEVRFAAGTRVRDVAFMGPTPTLGERALSAMSARRGDGEHLLPESPAPLLQEVDVEACTVAKAGHGPGEVYSGSCERTPEGLKLNGRFTPAGPDIDRVVPVVSIGRCLTIVDGFPMTGC